MCTPFINVARKENCCFLKFSYRRQVVKVLEDTDIGDEHKCLLEGTIYLVKTNIFFML